MISAVLLVSAVLARAAAPAPAPPRDPSLPPSAETAKAALESSPRHGEYVDVPYAGGPKLKTWISYPERRDKAGVVIVIQEVFGLTDWLRGVADQLAKEGFIAVAPDMVSGYGPNGGGTDSVPGRDDVVALVRKITPDEANRRLNAVREWAVKIPAGNGRVATVGFCWGGGVSFAYAGAWPDLAAAVVYYGTSPDPAIIDAIRAPVLGHYGGDDERVDATIPPAEAQMKKLGRTFEVHVYPGAGHGFLRDQAGRDGANLKATKESWPRTVAFLKEKLGGQVSQR
ncbi:MAG TPA: dienelactone hydrolase family protein [Thermoanaerobaculia bacterium]|nr:dienelactone hydrolase family protein [Thermoanaerobaculia bacterium]